MKGNPQKQRVLISTFAITLIPWAWNYLTFNRSARLITAGHRASIRDVFITLISSVFERAVSAFGSNVNGVGADSGSPSIARTPLALRLRVYSPESDAV